MQTIGISPKVKLPVGVLLVIGIVLTVLGFISGDDTLKTAGLSLIAASGITLPVGFAAPPAPTTDKGAPPADESTLARPSNLP